MNIKFLKVALGIALSATVLTASAQKTYTEGVVTYTITSSQGDIDTKDVFKGDSSAASWQAGPAAIKVITTGKDDYVAVLVDVPVAQMKNAGIATPSEMEDFRSKEPSFTFTPTTETKVINGYNCKKIKVKDTKSGSDYESWITNDISIPVNSISRYYKDAGGMPVQFTTIQMGQPVSVTLKSITDAKAPAGSFTVPSDYTKMTLTELMAMAGGH